MVKGNVREMNVPWGQCAANHALEMAKVLGSCSMLIPCMLQSCVVCLKGALNNAIPEMFPLKEEIFVPSLISDLFVVIYSSERINTKNLIILCLSSSKWVSKG